MAGRHHYNALTMAYPRDHLIEQGKRNGVSWEEHGHEGVNWLRFSRALHTHLDSGKEMHVDNAHPDGVRTMLNHYVHLRELHKQSMIPHIRATMSKLRSELGDAASDPNKLMQDAYKHLDANGGHAWAEKVSTLHQFNTQIGKLGERLKEFGQVQR